MLDSWVIISVQNCYENQANINTCRKCTKIQYYIGKVKKRFTLFKLLRHLALSDLSKVVQLMRIFHPTVLVNMSLSHIYAASKSKATTTTREHWTV
jgi:hypothetical protein